MGAPLADAQHDWTAGGVECLSNQRITCGRILGGRIAPIVFQIVYGPGSVLPRILIFVSEAPRPPGASLASRVRINPELQAQRMDVIGQCFDPGREALTDRQRCCRLCRAQPASNRRSQRTGSPRLSCPISPWRRPFAGSGLRLHCTRICSSYSIPSAAWARDCAPKACLPGRGGLHSRRSRRKLSTDFASLSSLRSVSSRLLTPDKMDC